MIDLPATWTYQERLEAARERVAIMVYDGGVHSAVARDVVAKLYGVKYWELRSQEGGSPAAVVGDSRAPI